MFDRTARATELAVAQKERFDNFKQSFGVEDSDTDVITAFYSQPAEATEAFLIANHLVLAAEGKNELFQK